MKNLGTLMLMMALGLSATYGLALSDNTFDLTSSDTQDFLEHLLAGDDDDDNENDDEIVDIDDALQKYRMLKSIARIVAQAEAMDQGNPKKRFIGGVFDKIKHAVEKAANKVKHVFEKAYDVAKSAFEKVTDAIPFDKAVDKLVPLLKSGMGKKACMTLFNKGVTKIKVLGPAANLAKTVSGPLCGVAIEKLAKLG